jgi:hypothetical protein
MMRNGQAGAGALEAYSADMREPIPESPGDPSFLIYDVVKNGFLTTNSSKSALSKSKDTASTFIRGAKASLSMLPNELLSQIFSYLDGPQPSASILLDEPYFNCTTSISAPLKACSRVSHRWRDLTIPTLFRHARLIAIHSEHPKQVLEKDVQPFIDFVNKNTLHGTISTYTLVIPPHEFDHTFAGKYWSNSIYKFWNTIFKVIDPIELLLVAPVVAIGNLTSCHVYLRDAWMFSAPCHYLHLKRDVHAPEYIPLSDEMIKNQPIAESSANISQISGDKSWKLRQSHPELLHGEASSYAESPQGIPRSKTSALMDARPWTSILLNEGSSIRAYATYEWWLRTPPSVSISNVFRSYI